MKTTSVFCSATMLAVVFGWSVAVPAQPPEPPSPTFWRFLGIPQNFQKIRDAVVNRKGKRPNWEAKPPLKALADPANLESPNPAIKAAAQIKAEEDLKDQKIKAIKYLATVGCGCHQGVKEALLAALDDCTEEVRYQAAIALCQASGNPCTACNPGSCCDPALMAKLKDVAFGQEANGCYKETSPRVRAAALNALNACERVVPAAAPKELPVEGMPKEIGPPLIEERGLEKKEKKKLPPAPGEGETAMIVNPVSLAQVVEGADGPEVDLVAGYGRWDSLEGCDPGYGRRAPARRPCRRYPAGKAAPGPEEALGPLAPGEEAPGRVAPEAPYYPPPTALAGTFGAAAGPQPVVPNMIGDFFGAATTFNNFLDAGQKLADDTTVAIAGGDRRFKIVESNRPIPTDRFFFNYHHFHNVLRDVSGAPRPFDRYTFGVEKTFLDELGSLELRVPFGTGLDSSQQLGNSLVATEFGNLALAAKVLLYQRRHTACGVGLGIVFPTGEDARLLDASYGTETVRVENEALHLQPFVGWVWTPNERFFSQVFAQLDLDASGNLVVMPNVTPDRLYDQNLLFLDVSAGYWLYRNHAARWITGIAPVVEAHYSSTLQDAGRVGETSPQGRTVTNPSNRMDVLNLTGGFHFELGPCSTLTVAAVAPLREDAPRSLGKEDNLFDAEFTMQFNRRF